MVNDFSSNVCDMLLLENVSFYVFKLFVVLVPYLGLISIRWKSYSHKLSKSLTGLVVGYDDHLAGGVLLVENWAINDSVIR